MITPKFDTTSLTRTVSRVALETLDLWLKVTGDPLSDTKTSSFLATLDTVLVREVVSNLGVIMGVFPMFGALLVLAGVSKLVESVKPRVVRLLLELLVAVAG